MEDIKYFCYFDYLTFLRAASERLPLDKYQALIETNHIKQMQEYANLCPVRYYSGQAKFKGTTTVDPILPLRDPQREHRYRYDPNFNLSFNDTMDISIMAVVDRAIKENKKIVIRYSGGIDSTMMLVALLKNLPSTERHRIQVMLNACSITEHVYFFNKFVRNLDLISHADLPHVLTDRILVDGWVEYPFWDYPSVKTTCEKVKMKIELPDTELFLKLCNESFVPLITVEDKIKWIMTNYYTSYSTSRTEMFMIKKGLSKDSTAEEAELWKSSYMCPFQSEYFANLRLANFDEYKIGGDPKANAKNYISDYIGEPYYHVKLPSGGLYCLTVPDGNFGNGHMFAIDQNYNVYHAYDTTYINKFADLFISGEQFNV